MFWFCASLSAAGVLESVICSCLVAELVGYRLYGVLHSDTLLVVSRRHLVHHLLLYGPQRPIRAGRCQSMADGRLSRGDIDFSLVTRHGLAGQKGLAIRLLRYRLAKSLSQISGKRFEDGEAAIQ
jgi:hypothetical protein